jgi:hypothetical protein
VAKDADMFTEVHDKRKHCLASQNADRRDGIPSEIIRRDGHERGAESKRTKLPENVLSQIPGRIFS